jgi:hypothetical protein
VGRLSTATLRAPPPPPRACNQPPAALPAALPAAARAQAFAESLSTLKFANRAKNIKNEARVNEDLDQKSLLRRYERELKQLRAELEERSRSAVDERRLIELDDLRKRAEEDKVRGVAAAARARRAARSLLPPFLRRHAPRPVPAPPRRWRPSARSRRGRASL